MRLTATNSFETDVVSTLRYSDFFNFPLTVDELYAYFPRRYERLEFVNQLQSTSMGGVKYMGSYFFLPGREAIVGFRQSRQQASAQKMEIARRVSLQLSQIPWIVFIGLTGAAAVQNATLDDDVDLLFITESNRLWLSRFKVVRVLESLGVRRRPVDQDVSDKVCANYYLSMDALSVSPKNLYTAHELIQMVPLYVCGDAYEHLQKANEWVFEYFPNFKWRQNILVAPSHRHLMNVWWNIAELLLRQLQMIYMLPKITNEQVSATVIKLHPQDRSQSVLEALR